MKATVEQALPQTLNALAARCDNVYHWSTSRWMCELYSQERHSRFLHLTTGTQPAEVRSGFPQFLQQNEGISSRLGRSHFLPDPLYFTTAPGYAAPAS
jgi:hypothetical protein